MGLDKKQALSIMQTGHVEACRCVGNMHGRKWEPRCKAITERTKAPVEQFFMGNSVLVRRVLKRLVFDVRPKYELNPVGLRLTDYLADQG